MKKTIDNTFREALKAAANEVGGQDILAQKSGVHKTMISRYLNKKTKSIKEDPYNRLYPYMEKFLKKEEKALTEHHWKLIALYNSLDPVNAGKWIEIGRNIKKSESDNRTITCEPCPYRPTEQANAKQKALPTDGELSTGTEGKP